MRQARADVPCRESVSVAPAEGSGRILISPITTARTRPATNWVRRFSPIVATAAGISLGAARSTAGTIRHDRLDADYRAYANQSQFAAVGSYSTGGLFGSFTLISPTWALTAAHVVDTDKDGLVSDEVITNDRLTLGGVQYTATQIIVPTGVNGNGGWNGSINDGFDIALVRLDRPVPTSITPARLYTTYQELGKQITSVGFGQGGTGLTGSNTASGTKRAGDNVVDRFTTFSNGLTALRWDFDQPAPRTSSNDSGSPTPLNMEYLIGPGDSGGGSFIFEDNAWYVAGVHSGTYDLNGSASTYGDAALITRVAAYQDFIYSVIPELRLTAVTVPEPAHLAVFGLAGLLSTRRRRFR
jgi:V8-like Glu-specific endopeptidase